MSYDYDFFIVGAGPGGIAAAKAAAACGVRVAIAEPEKLGGTCVNRGCVPKKLIVYAADFALHDRLANGYGWSECHRQLDWSKFIAAVHQHLDKLNQSYLQTLEQAGVELIRSRATFKDEHTIEVGDRSVTADKILIAVGGHPLIPDIPGKEYGISSREMFHLSEIPQRLAIIGGGYVGVEFSSMMNALGAHVTLMETDAKILSGFDQAIRSTVQQGLSNRGIEIFTGTTAKEIQQNSEGLHLSLSGEGEQTITADTVLIATGRAPNTQDLGLENAGVAVGEKGEVQVDEYSRTAQEHIFAIGDCTARIPLTPVAKAEASAVVATAFSQPRSVKYEYATSAVFSRPEAATIGMTEAKAKEKFGDAVRCYTTQFSPLQYSLAPHEEPVQAMIKLVVQGDSEQVLGAHMVGEHAADIIQSLGVAIRQGITKPNLDEAIGIHPTIGEEFLTFE